MAPRAKAAVKLSWLVGPMSFIGSLARQKPSRPFAVSRGPPAVSKTLTRKLLALAGTSVVISFDSENLSKHLLAEGALVRPTRVMRKPGRVSDCHANAARLWAADKSRVLMSGYALSADGFWRRHSWLLVGTTLLETTEERTHYFGVMLSPEMARCFHQTYL